MGYLCGHGCWAGPVYRGNRLPEGANIVFSKPYSNHPCEKPSGNAIMAFLNSTLESLVIGLQKRAVLIGWVIAQMLVCAGLVQGGEVRVAVASNFANCLRELGPIFSEFSGHEVVPAVGSTGRHYAQISAGAPFDVFLSADCHHAQLLVDQGLADETGTFIYAKGQLVLWLAQPKAGTLGNLLNDETIKPIAMANPRLAPYGEAVLQVLENLKLPADLNGRIIMGTNVGQAWQFAATGNAKAALVAHSLVRDFPKNQVIIVPENLYDSINQQAVLLTRASSSKPARDFLNFLAGETAQTVIRNHGYIIEKKVP